MTDAADYCWHCLEPHGEGAGCAACGEAPHAGLSDLGHVLAAGEVLGDRFLLGRMLGQGGFGVVYLGRDLRLDARVAIKEYFPRNFAARSRDGQTVHATGGDDPDAYGRGLRRFVREARVSTKFRSHPNVVTVLDYVEAHGTAYLVMEYLEGRSAAELAKAHGGRLDEAIAVEIAIAALDGLHAVHELGLVHHDVKPANVYVTREGPVKLMDFGAVRHALGAGSGHSTMYLTPGYAPPESYAAFDKGGEGRWTTTGGWSSPQGSLHAIGPWTDVYGVGAMLWELLVGRPPTDAQQRQALQVTGSDPVQSPREVVGDIVSLEVSAAVMKSLALRSGDRFQHARSMQDALLPPVVAPPEPPRPKPLPPEPPPPEPPPAPVGGNSAMRMAMVVGAIALAGILGWQAAASRSEGRSEPGVGMVTVPAGEFWMGCNPKVDTECAADEKPGRTMTLPAFSIDRTEVTVEAFARCVDSGLCSAHGLTMPFWDGEERPKWAKWCNWGKAGRERHPINCVYWSQAAAYCKWAKKRLPTEAEWEKAARGTDGRKYPWGNTGYDALEGGVQVANIADQSAKGEFRGWATTERYDDGAVGTSVVQRYRAGRSPYGADDMIGNVWEWVSDWYTEGKYRSIRGGGWSLKPAYARASARPGYDPMRRYGGVGFRCAQ